MLDFISTRVRSTWAPGVLAATLFVGLAGCAVDADDEEALGAYESGLVASGAPGTSVSSPPPDSCGPDATLTRTSVGFTCACVRACLDHWTKYDVRGGREWTGLGCLVACRAIKYGACDDPFPPTVCLELPNKDWSTICTASKDALCAMLAR